LLKAIEIFGTRPAVLPDRSSSMLVVIQSCFMIFGIFAGIYFCVLYLATMGSMRQLVRSKLTQAE
jgi:hypothetical protein